MLKAVEDAVQRMYAKAFIDFCKRTFKWSDFSKDVILEVGCGEKAYTSKTILEVFPEVARIIAVDKLPGVVRKVSLEPVRKIEYAVADIEKRATLQSYEGKITKVVATRCFHQLMDKKTGFENVYHLLPPNGEAAFEFATKCPLRRWAVELLKKPKWRETFKGDSTKDVFFEEFGSFHYEKLVKKLGFQVVHYREAEQEVSFSADAIGSKGLYDLCQIYFKVPDELVEEYRADSIESVLKTGGRYSNGKLSLKFGTVTLLLVKPANDSFFITQKSD